MARRSPIKEILDVRGIRYVVFAQKLGLPHQVAFTRIEGGEQEPPPGYYEKAAELLGVPVTMVTPEPAEVAS